ncbi:MAG: immunoglobulin domain-containing protein [Holophaga sp.]
MDIRLESFARIPAWKPSLGRVLTSMLAGLFVLFLAACGGSNAPAPATPAPLPPAITAHPVSKAVTEGEGVSFTVAATGSATLHYQWKKDGANVGSDTATFSLTTVHTGDAGSYTVAVSNPAGSVTSGAAALTVNPIPVAPTITSQSTSQSVTVGDRVILVAAATGTAPLQYQWKKNGANLGGDSFTYTLEAALLTDSGSYTVTVTNSAGTVTSAPIELTVQVAVDWKGLTAAEEAFYGLNPNLLDTDGDGISDFDEIKKFGFDPANDPYKFNPLIADMPSVKIELTSPPYFQIKYDYTNGSSASSSTERSSSSTQSVTTSVEAGITLHQEASVATQVTAKAGVLEWGGAQMTGTLMLFAEESLTLTSEQAWENSQTLTNAEALENSHEVASSEAKMAITVRIRNTGHTAFTLKNLVLSGTTVDRMGSSILRPIGNLEYEGSSALSSGFPESTLAPGDSITGLTFSNRLLYVDTAKQMLRDSSNLYVGVAAYEIADPLTGLPSNAQMTEIGAKTAAILIDYDTYSARDTEKFRVATNIVEGAPGVSLKTILERYLHLPCETGAVNGKTGLTKLRTYGTSSMEHTRWVITHVFHEAGELNSSTYDPTMESYDLGSITVKAGDLVSLMYVVDKDGDGLPHRLERAMGSDDTVIDSIPGDAYPNDFAWYLGGHPIQNNGPGPKYQIVYNGNGHTGGIVPSDSGFYPPGQFVPVVDNPGGLVKINVGGISYRFLGWNTEPDGRGSAYSASKPYVMGSGSAILYAMWASYEVGDIGPAGGKIFYKKNYYSDGWRYMEAAPYNQNGSYAARWVEVYGKFWNAPNTALKGAWGRAIGDGVQNTLDIEKEETSYNTAADICANLVINRYSDWFLPSYDEMLHMKDMPGALSTTTTYWTSSQRETADPTVQDKFWYTAIVVYNEGNPPAMSYSIDYIDRQSPADSLSRPIKVRAARRF